MTNFFIAFLGVYFSGQQASILFGFSSSKSFRLRCRYRHLTTYRRYRGPWVSELYFLARIFTADCAGDERKQPGWPRQIRFNEAGERTIFLPTETFCPGVARYRSQGNLRKPARISQSLADSNRRLSKGNSWPLSGHRAVARVR